MWSCKDIAMHAQHCSRFFCHIENCMKLKEFCEMWNNIVECGINMEEYINAE